MLAGIVAPRGLFVIENTSMEWLGNLSTCGCMKTAHLIWKALGVSDSMGFSQVGNQSLCLPVKSAGRFECVCEQVFVGSEHEYGDYEDRWDFYL